VLARPLREHLLTVVRQAAAADLAWLPSLARVGVLVETPRKAAQAALPGAAADLGLTLAAALATRIRDQCFVARERLGRGPEGDGELRLGGQTLARPLAEEHRTLVRHAVDREVVPAGDAPVQLLTLAGIEAGTVVDAGLVGRDGDLGAVEGKAFEPHHVRGRASALVGAGLGVGGRRIRGVGGVLGWRAEVGGGDSHVPDHLARVARRGGVTHGAGIPDGPRLSATIGRRRHPGVAGTTVGGARRNEPLRRRPLAGGQGQPQQGQ